MNTRIRRELARVELICMKCGNTFLTENPEDTIGFGKYILKRCIRVKQDGSCNKVDSCPHCHNTNKRDFRLFIDEQIKLQKFFELLELHGNSDMYRRFTDDKRSFVKSADNRMIVRIPIMAMTALGFEADNAIVMTTIRTEKISEFIEFIKKHTKKRLTVAGLGNSCPIDSVSFRYDDVEKYNLNSFYLGLDSGEYRNVDIGEVILDRDKVTSMPKSQAYKMQCTDCSEGTGIKITKTPYCPGCGGNNTLVRRSNCLICLGSSIPKHPFKADNFKITTDTCTFCMGRGYMNVRKDFFRGPLGIPIPKGVAEVLATSTFAYMVKVLSGSGRLNIKTEMFDILVFRSRAVFSQSDRDDFLGPIGVQITEFDRSLDKERS